ncbi:ABC-three component system protein [Shewanella algae]|uniref:ABC-three component system protein n=1 Tax=Shewanella algae TaxID=38313 RepID=UPI0031F5B284
MSDDFFEQVAADKSQLGFDYQDLVCLEYLIDMKQGESVGLEVLDDVHHERIHGGKALIQVKHSVDETEAVTNRDLDLWKTLYNWSKALECISDDDIQLIFFTNKKKTIRKGLVELLAQTTIKLTDIEEKISLIKDNIDKKESFKEEGAADNPVKKYVDYIDSLTSEQKDRLFSKIVFIFSVTDIFDRLRSKIEYFSIDNNKSLDVIYQLIGVYRKKKYELIKGGNKLNIDFDTFRKEFQFDRVIKLFQDRKVDFSSYHSFKNINNINPKDGVFAKQLEDINIDSDEIVEYAMEYATTSMFIQKMISEGEFSTTEDEAVNEELYSSWRTLHKRNYNGQDISNEQNHMTLARNCLYNLEDTNLVVSNSTLAQPMVIGKGMELSDLRWIGWRKDWKKVYGGTK